MQDIAVIGIANIFPGSTTPEGFWQQLLAKQDCRSKASAVQMGAEVEKYQGNKGDTDKFYCVHGGYITDFNFQPTVFCDNQSGLSAEYLTQLDDLQHWSLYVTQQALQDAGYWRSEQLEDCGLILGNLSFPTKSSNHLFMPLYHQVVDDTLAEIVNADFQLSAFSAGQNSVKEQRHCAVSQQASHENADTIHADNALVAGYPAALLAKAAGLGGAHFALDAACASSCYSVKIACDYLHTGKANMMLAGAVSAADPMFVNMGFSIFQAFPENNIHAPFDQHSQGLFAGEGAGMMVLKRHSDAVRDGDKIHAIIKGGALSNDGKGEFVLSPNTKGQVLAYERAYENAGVNPAEVDYIECHATGTPKGDNVELSSMETFFSRYNLNDADKPLLGSVKSNLGHLLTAAGMPGMTKAIWALNTGKIPATINLTAPLSSKKGYFTGAHMPTETCDWPIKSSNVDTSNISGSSDSSDKSDNANNQTKAELPHDKPRIAGVSVFGFGGANAHLVLQAPTQHVNSVKEPVYKPQPLAIVGMDAHFGHAHNLAAFEQLLTTNATTFRALPEQRWKGIENNQAVMQALNLKQAPMGGYVDSFEIDFLRFKVPPNEQDSLIPQQLMMMKVADNAARDANLTPGSNVAVLVAMGMELALHQYRGRVNLTTQIEQSLLQQGVTLTPEQQQTLTNIAKDGVDFSAQLNQYTSFIGNIMASRISALWDFSGPAITVSAEENSVYRCVELAQNLCQTSDVEAVIIASVDLSGSIENITLRQHYGELDCRPLPQQLAAEKTSHTALFSSQQWQVGEGAAAFVVKRADEDLLHQSRNSSLNLNQSQNKQAQDRKTNYRQTHYSQTHNGQVQSNQVNDTFQDDKRLSGSQRVYAIINSVAFVNDTNSQAITKAASQALAQAQLMASDITEVEAHASGFINENKAEGEALPRLYNNSTISSVKRHIGHTFNASGAASIIKTALALSAEKQPKWHAINGLGKDGSCAHLILGAVNSAGKVNTSNVNAGNVNDSKISASKVDVPHVHVKQSNALPVKKYQLKKTINLGGHNIRETMLLASQSSVNQQQISQIKATFNMRALLPVTNNTNGIDLTLIKPRFNPRGIITADNSINTIINTNTLHNRHLDNAFTFSSGVSVKQPLASNSVLEQQRTDAMQNDSTTKNNSAIDTTSAKNNTSAIPRQVTQQAATHQAFLKQRQQAQAQIATLLTLQLDAELNANIANKIGEGSLSSPNKQFSQASISKASTLPASTSQAIEERPSVLEAVQLPVPEGFAIQGPKGYAYPPLALRKRFNQTNNIIWDTADLIEFAEGDIAKVFGDDYKIIDSYSRRVRLPSTDYLLVSRVTALEAKLHAYKKSYMCTEYDIPVDAPFLIDGQIPWSVSVESGQCDLLLIAFIGIDFQAQGERVYRLLDCELTFLEDMAFGGETLRYEIHIDSYAKNGEQLLFFFHYDCYVGDKKVLIMRNGCAGFFTDEELHDGKGVILNDSDKAQLTQAKKSVFTPLMQRHRDIYHYADMMKLVNGDLAGCFGQGYDQQGRNPSLKFSSAKFLMIERITNINSLGGHWGLGLIEGQKELAPEHWYFPCHFKDDQVMAGSLMSEGCGQMAMFYMLSLGMHKYVNNARFQPVPGESQTVRCRGQVLPQTNTLTYRMEVTDIGMHPYPFLKANIDIILDGKVVVDFKNLSVMIKEQDQQSPYPVTLPENVVLYDKDHNNLVPFSMTGDADQSSDNKLSDSQPEQFEQDERGLTPFKHLQRPLMKVISDFSAPSNKGVIPIKHFMAPMLVGQNRIPDKAPFSPWHLFEFATGNIANCFGADFDVYQGRIPPRTPCGDLQVVTQVVEVKGKRLDFNDPASCVAEYFVPEDAWYFTHNSHQAWMPYSLIMEIALQPNGFISGYMGTTLAYPDKDLFFRNLDGSGELVKQLDLRGKTIVNKSTLLSTTMAGGMIVQSFTFALYAIESGLSDNCNGHDDLAVEALFYQGTAVFGYFAEAALTNQLGIDNGKTTTPWFVENKTAKADIISLDLRNENFPLYQAPQGKPHYKLTGGKMNFIDNVSIVEGGGSAGIAYVYGERCIDASDWFFRYHFHQDPVMPGSLGVEAIIELLQTYALHNNLGAAFDNPRFIAPMTSVKWKYRGQITPLNKQMSLDIHITNIVKSADEVRLVGEANLSKDGLRIYQVSDLVLSIVEA